MSKPDAGPGEPGFRDRSRRLVLFGALSALVGAACAGLGLLSLLLPLLHRFLPQGSAPAPDARSAALGFLTYLLAGAILVWAGVGSMRRRRWVPPVMLTIAWTWIFLGAFGLLAILVLLGDLPHLASPASAWPPGMILAMQVLVLGFAAVAGLLLPALFLWAYRDAAVSRTCQLHDPGPSWTDHCPWPVLLLSLELGLAALLTLFLALRPAVPVFGLLVTGWKGGLLLLCGSAAAGYLALATYRRSRGAWWATTLLLIAAGLSMAITCWLVEPARLYREMYGTYADQVPASSSALLRAAGIWGSLGLTALSLLYMIAIRRHFAQATEDRREAGQT